MGSVLSIRRTLSRFKPLASKDKQNGINDKLDTTSRDATTANTISKAPLKRGSFVGSLDCGTTSVRFIVFDDQARIVAQTQREFDQYYPNPGWHEHDAKEIQAVSEFCIRKACEELEEKGWEAASIEVIGITNQRETAVVWDKTTGEPLCRAIVWDDARTKATVAHFEYKLKTDGLEVEPGIIKKGDEAIDALRDISGLPLSTYFSAIKLCWMLDEHEGVRKAHEEDNLSFGTVESWLVYNLTGGVLNGLHVTEPTNASRTLLLDIHTLQWSPSLLKFFNLRPSILPKLVSSSEVVGTMSDGPLKGVRIAGLVGDQQGALVGNKCFRQGEAKCTYGTGAFLLFNTGTTPVKSEHGLLTTVAYQPGPGKPAAYALEGSIAVAGSAINWLRDGMGMIQSSKEVNELASKEPTTGGVYFVTAFSGLLAPYWDPGAGGLLIGLTKYTNPAHIARAALEAIGFQTRAVIESMLLDVTSASAKEKMKEAIAAETEIGSSDESLQVFVEEEIKAVPEPELIPTETAIIAVVPEPSLTGSSTKDKLDILHVESVEPPSPSTVSEDEKPETGHRNKPEQNDDSDDDTIEFTHLKVDGGVTNGDLCMHILADVGGFSVMRPEMRESTALGSALLAGAAIGLFGWDLNKPGKTMSRVNTEGAKTFKPQRTVEEREEHWKNWKKAVERSRGWDEAMEK